MAQSPCILTHLAPDGPVALVGDDTLDGHPGRHVYGEARHRDPVRSSHGSTAWRYGHTWAVPAVLVRSPFATRPRALPALVDLYRCEEDDRRRGRPHRTPAQLMCRLLRLLLIRFPDRRSVFVGDGGYGSHEVARSARRHRGRLTPVSKLHPEANPFEPPPPYGGEGRPPVKGDRRPEPSRAVAAASGREELSVAWYGGGGRRVEVVTDTGHWYKAGEGLVPIGRVFVRDRDGTHRDAYLYATDPGPDAATIIGRDTSRRSIETTSQELRCHLGPETTRGWWRRAVERAAPCLSGLYSVVALLYHALPGSKRSAGVEWPGEAVVTFSDAPASVRLWLWLWSGWVCPRAGGRLGLGKFPDPLREVLRAAPAPAA